MKPGERIPLHDHSDFNSGGPLKGTSVLLSAGLGGPVGGGSTGSGDTTDTSDFELNIEGGQSVISAHGSMGATETFDPTDGNVHTGTLNANCTFTLSVPTGTGACTLEFRLTQDGTGGWVITWPGTVTVIGTLVTTASTTSIVIVESLDGGTTWVAVVVGGATVAALDDLSDVTITTPTTSDRLRYNGSAWVNSTAMWVPAMVEDGATGLWYVVVTGDGDAVMTEVP